MYRETLHRTALHEETIFVFFDFLSEIERLGYKHSLYEETRQKKMCGVLLRMRKPIPPFGVDEKNKVMMLTM